MSTDPERSYYLKRERECREAAARATDTSIRRIHLDFAAHYAREAAMLADVTIPPGRVAA